MIRTDHLRVLGTGTSVSEPGIFPSSYIINIKNNLTLIDAGQGISQRIVSLGYCLKNIQTILVTHIHSDHSMGIPEILMAILNDDRIDNHTLNICISMDYISFIKNKLLYPWKEWICKSDKIKINYIPLIKNKTQITESIQIKPLTVNHHPSSFGLMLKTGGKVIFITGDTDIFHIESEIKNDTDILFIDSTTDDSHKTAGHLTVSEAVELIQKTQIPEVYLTHMLPQYRQEIIKFTETMQKTEGQLIKPAYEGQIISIE